MKQFLRLRHWQLFLVSWGLLVAFFACLIIQPEIVGHYLSVWIVIFFIGLINSFIWVWSTVMLVIPTIDQHLRPKDKLFKICFWIPAIFISYIVGFMLFNFFVRKVESLNPETELDVYIGLVVLNVGCITYGLLFAARIIKTAELQRTLKVYEYLTEFFLMILAPIGLWIVQPRLNKIIQDNR